MLETALTLLVIWTLVGLVASIAFSEFVKRGRR